MARASPMANAAVVDDVGARFMGQASSATLTSSTTSRRLDGAREALVELGHEREDRLGLEPQHALGDAPQIEPAQDSFCWGPRNGPQTPSARTRPGAAVARPGNTGGPQTPSARTRPGA